METELDRLAADRLERRLTRRDFLARAAALGLGVSAAGELLAACGGSPPTTSGGAAERPRYGGTLVVSGTDPGAMNPAITSAGTTHPVTGQMFNGLVRLDRRFEPQPDLARSWRASPDGLTFTFDLVPTARWHDGQPFTSRDVQYTFEQVLVRLHPRTRVALGPVLESVTTPDDHTVVFRLKQPYAPFLKVLNEDNGAILPRHIFEGTDPLTNPANAKPVGTGPFMFDSQVKGDRITLVRNPHYFKPGRPYLDRIVFRVIASSAQAFQAFQAGDLNVLTSPGPADVPRLRAMPNVVVTDAGREGFGQVIHLIPNLRRKPFDDVRVRQALAHAIDRSFIARTAEGGLLQPATGPIDNSFAPWYTDRVPRFPHDVARARALLDQAGLPAGGDGVRFRASFIFDPSFAREADLLKQQLGQAGVALDLQVMDFNAWVNRLYLRWDFDLGYSHLTDPPDPDIGVKRVFSSANIAKVPFANGAGYSNPKVDALFDSAARELDQAKRVALYDEIQRIVTADQAHFFLVSGSGLWAHDAAFRGFEDAGALSTYYFGDTVWWTKGAEALAGTGR